MKLLERVHISNCNATRTPVDIESKLSYNRDPVFDPILYHSLAGGIQYPPLLGQIFPMSCNISYDVQEICLYMHDPREPHLAALKRVIRYVHDTSGFGLQLYASSSSSLVVYPDADWTGSPTTKRSTPGNYVFLGNNLLSWLSKRQHTLSRSSAEPEYRGVSNVVTETAWLPNLVQHQRIKHIEIDIHSIRDMVARGQVCVLHVPSRYQYADIITKGLPSTLFEKFSTSLSVRSSPAQTAREC
ncbi:ribonuclease H-like domain-containing protein [Tanacetum coccineum]